MRNFIYLNKWTKRVLPESAEEFHSPRKGEERRCADIASHIYNRVKLYWRKIVKKFSQEKWRKKKGERERPRRIRVRRWGRQLQLGRKPLRIANLDLISCCTGSFKLIISKKKFICAFFRCFFKFCCQVFYFKIWAGKRKNNFFKFFSLFKKKIKIPNG